MGRKEDREIKFWVDNLYFLLQQRERILADPVLSRAQSPVAFLSIAYLSGSAYLPIGVLLELWRDGVLCEECPVCNWSVHLTYLAGSPLSGYCMRSGICFVCRAGYQLKGGNPSLMERAAPVLKKLKEWSVEEDPTLGGMSIAGESGKLSLGEPRVAMSRDRPISIQRLVQLLKREQKQGSEDV